jgi:hypothetical protein
MPDRRLEPQQAVLVVQLAPRPTAEMRPLSEERVLYLSDDAHVTADHLAPTRLAQAERRLHDKPLTTCLLAGAATSS